MVNSVFTGDIEQQVYVYLNLFSSIVGSLASVIMIKLIFKMHVQNGHILLVLTMSWFQLMYDFTFFFSDVDVNYTVLVIANVGQIVGGIGGSLVSNWIAFIAFYVVKYKRSFNIFRYYRAMILSCTLPGVINAIIYVLGSSPPQSNEYLINVSILGMYYYIRLVSIGINFILCVATALIINDLSSKKVTKSYQEQAIRTLALRMIYYPIVQAVGRSGYAWYEYEYGTDLDPSSVTQQQFAAQCSFTIITPMVSVGYLIIFLVMQPHAYKYFKALVTCSTYSPNDHDVSTAPQTNSMGNESDLFATGRTSTGVFSWTASVTDQSAEDGEMSMWRRDDDELMALVDSSGGTLETASEPSRSRPTSARSSTISQITAAEGQNKRSSVNEVHTQGSAAVNALHDSNL